MLYYNKIKNFKSLINLLERSYDEDDEIDDFISSLDTEGSRLINTAKETEWPLIDYSEFAFIVKNNYEIKAPSLFGGPPGVGKTEVIETAAEEIARDLGLKFVNFKDINESNIQHYIDNIKKYFIFMDMRTASMEPSDMQGIPNISDQRDFLIFKIPTWAYISTLPGSSGILFFDEINQGRPDVIKTLYSICHPKERKIGSPARRLGDGWVVFAAGNFGMDSNDALPQALVNRFETYEVEPDVNSWLQWAENRKPPIFKYITKFIESSPTEGSKNLSFYNLPESSEQQFPSPRSFEKLSKQLYSLQDKVVKYQKETGKKFTQHNLLDLITKISAANCGIEWARKFRYFLSVMKDFSLETVAKEKQLQRSNFDARKTRGEIPDTEVFNDTAYPIVAAVAEKIRQALLKEATSIIESPKSISKELKKSIEYFCEIVNVIQDDDLAFVLFKLLMKGTPEERALIKGAISKLGRANTMDNNTFNRLVRIGTSMNTVVELDPNYGKEKTK